MPLNPPPPPVHPPKQTRAELEAVAWEGAYMFGRPVELISIGAHAHVGIAARFARVTTAASIRKATTET